VCSLVNALDGGMPDTQVSNRASWIGLRLRVYRW
jgi:hypothetical protein